jgi:hypothetical protein
MARLEECNVWKKEKRKEFGQNAHYWTVQNSHMNLLKDLEQCLSKCGTKQKINY